MARSRNESRKLRHRRIRKRIFGTKDRPRLCVFKSAKHIAVQLIDDAEGKTIASHSTYLKDFPKTEKEGGKKAVAKVVGEMIGTKLNTLGVKKISFDRNGYAYNGRVKALAEAIRTKGIDF